MRRFFLITLVGFVGGFIFLQVTKDNAPSRRWRFSQPDADATAVTAEKRLDASYPAGSRLPDKEAPGGDASCDNYPANLGKHTWGTEDAVSLVAFPEEVVAYGKHKGIALRLVNRTAEVVPFQVCEASLILVPEALDEKGRWREIESPSQSTCGNSYRRVFLKSDQYWQFPARLYDGTIKTKIRYRLDPTGLGDENPLYSNIIEGKVSAVQFRMGPDRAKFYQAMESKDPSKPGVVAVLAEALEDDEERTSYRAAVLLADFGPSAKEAAGSLRRAMKSKDMILRAVSAYALWRVENNAEEALKTLIGVLESGDDRAVCGAALWLGEMGGLAKSAVPALCKTLTNSADEPSRRRSAEALGEIHAGAEVAVPVLIKALSDAHNSVRTQAADALGRYGTKATAAVLMLSGALKEKETSLKIYAASALWRIERKPDRVLPVLMEALQLTNDAPARTEAAERLGELGPLARAAVPQLTELLQDKWRATRVTAAGALWRITGEAKPSVEALVVVIGQLDRFARKDKERILVILSEMGPQARATVPALLKLLKDEKPPFREQFENVLKRIDPEAAKKAGVL